MNNAIAEKVLQLLKEASKGSTDAYADPFISRIAEYGDDAIPILMARLDTLLGPGHHDHYETRFLIRTLRLMQAKTCLGQVVDCAAKILLADGGAGVLYQCYFFIRDLGGKDAEAFATLEKSLSSVSESRRTFISDISWDEALRILEGV